MNEIKVRRGNVILRVSENELAKVKARGFDVLGADGKVVEASVPNDVGILKKAFTDHTNEIKRLKEIIQEKNDEIEKLKAPKPRKRKTESE